MAATLNSRVSFFSDKAHRAELTTKLSRQCRARVNRIRKTIGYDALPNDDLAISLDTATSLAYFRVLINRFSTEIGLDADWWRDKRRTHSRTAKDRTNDFSIITTYFPHFERYEPPTPVTDREILDAAEKELFDLLAAPGSEYHDTHMQVYRKTEKYADPIPFMPDATAIKNKRTERSREYEYSVVDPSAQDRIENVFVFNMLDDDRNIFGPGLGRVAAVAIRTFGRGGLFWLAEWLFFPGRYTDLMRVIGLDEAALGQTKFEAVKRDMIRKLPQVHEDMMASLRNDPVMLKLRDLLYEDDFLATLPPASPLVSENKYIQMAREERAAFFIRARNRMLEYVRTDLELRYRMPFVEEDTGELLNHFIVGETRPDRMERFRKELRKMGRPTMRKKAA